jgi:N-acetylmuramoyl-L-alanine amidase
METQQEQAAQLKERVSGTLAAIRRSCWHAPVANIPVAKLRIDRRQAESDMRGNQRMTWLACGLCLLALPLPAEQGSDTPEVFPGGTARLRYRGQVVAATSFSRAPLGPLFGLVPIASLLGIKVEIGPLGDSHTLFFADRRIVVGPDQAAMVVIPNDIKAETDTLTLNQRPHKVASGLQVSLDFLALTFGERLNQEFQWNAEALELELDSRQLRELTATVDLIHQSGLSTLTISFSQPPRYQLEELPGALEIRLLGDRLLEPLPFLHKNDPLVAGLEVLPDRLRVRLAEGAVSGESRMLGGSKLLVLEIIRQSTTRTRDALNSQVALRPSSKVRTIVIDPGHGGQESGAVGPQGTLEKDLALQVARALQRQLVRRLGVSVKLTRDEDVDIPYDSRTAIANENKADLFISLHFNSSFGSRAHGAETFFLSREASDEMAAAAAAAENQTAAGGEDPELDLKLILWDLSQSYHLAESHRFASLVQKELNATLGLRDRGVKQAPFRVLIGANMPAVLVELGFLSNPKEETQLQSAAYRAQLVDALVRAVRLFKTQLESRETTANTSADTSGNTSTPLPTSTGVEGRP